MYIRAAMCGKFVVHAWRYSGDLNKEQYRFIKGRPILACQGVLNEFAPQ